MSSDLNPVGEELSGKKRGGRRYGAWLLLGIILVLICSVALGPVANGIKQAAHNASMQQGRQIGQMMFSYSTDNTANGNAYPDGSSSTEVFQKLIDGGYCTDPGVFYVPLPGKVKALPGQKLRPENVCWDVTGGVDLSSSGLVPLIFLTGYKIDYAAASTATPTKNSPPESSSSTKATMRFFSRLWDRMRLRLKPSRPISNRTAITIGN